MAIGIEGSNIAEFGGVQNNSTSVDCGTESNRFLLVGIACFNSGSQVTVSTITYNSVALTLIASINTVPGGGGNISTYVYGLVNPASGSNTLVVNMSADPDDGPAITAIPCYNVEQTSVAAAVRDSVTDEDTANDLSFSPSGVTSTDHTFAFSNDFGGGSTWNLITERTEHVKDSNYISQADDVNISLLGCTCNQADCNGIALALINEEPTPTQDQEGYRFRNDDGSESAATWKAAQDTDINLGQNEEFRLRVLVNATNDPDAGTYTLQYRRTGDPASEWEDVE